MLAHEYFHEQAHLEKHHELKRYIFLFILFLIYRIFCHLQEYEADKIAAEKCGKKEALKSLKLLKMTEKKQSIFSLHPRTEKRIGKIIQKNNKDNIAI